MRSAQLAVLLLALLGTAFGKDKRAEAEALFSRANAALRFSISGPYTVKGHLKIMNEGGQPQEGTFVKAVQSGGVWRREITMPGYSEIAARNGQQRWFLRSTPNPPPGIALLVAALQPDLQIISYEVVEKIGDERVSSVQAKCIKLGASREVCLDAASGLLLRDRVFSARKKQVDYENYSGATGKQLPNRVRVSQAGKVVAELWLDSLSADLPDKSLFEPLQDALLCDRTNTKPPSPIFTPDPDYPESLRHDRIQGNVSLHIVIDEQGQADDIVVVGSLDPSLDKAAMAAVSRWRFKPAMCGDIPVPVEMNIQVGFRLR